MLLWKWACEVVTAMDIEGKGCVEATANMESGVFCTGGGSPLLHTPIADGSPSLCANTAAFLITTPCEAGRLFNHGP